MKKIVAAMLGMLVFASFSIMNFAHGVVFETQDLDENKIRITLKWDEPNATKGIKPIFWDCENGKVLTIGYEINNNLNENQPIDFDQRSVIPPMRIVLQPVGEEKIPVFSDIAGIYEEIYIRNLHDSKIVSGLPDGTFRPLNLVTRAEFVTMLCKILKMDQTPKDMSFTDINDHWAKGVMQAAFNKGFIKGYADNTIRPDKPISMAEVCAVLDKAFTFKQTHEGLYQKLKRGKWFTASVKKMFDAGIMTVKDPLYKEFDEDKSLSRADIAMMLSRAATTY